MVGGPIYQSTGGCTWAFLGIIGLNWTQEVKNSFMSIIYTLHTSSSSARATQVYLVLFLSEIPGAETARLCVIFGHSL